jgi:hypothetical protein
MRKAGGFPAPRAQEFQGCRRCAEMFRAGPGAAAPILLERLAAGSGPRPRRSLAVVTEDRCGAVPVFRWLPTGRLQATARLEISVGPAIVRAGGYRREGIKNCGRLDSPDREYGQVATLSPMVFGTARYAGHPCA